MAIKAMMKTPATATPTTVPEWTFVADGELKVGEDSDPESDLGGEMDKLGVDSEGGGFDAEAVGGVTSGGRFGAGGFPAGELGFAGGGIIGEGGESDTGGGGDC